MDELYDTNEPAVNTNGGSVGNWNMACFQMYYGQNIDIDVNAFLEKTGALSWPKIQGNRALST